MNNFIRSVKALDLERIKRILKADPKWLHWGEKNGKNALHYLCERKVADIHEKNVSLQILKLLLKKGMNINSTHHIPEEGCSFPATPLWYAYAKGRNDTLYKYLLRQGADPNHCTFALAWNDDVKAAELFKKHGARTTDNAGNDTPFFAAVHWKKFRMVAWFLKNGADVNAIGPNGDTPLLYVVQRKYAPEHVKLLLEYGADVDKENGGGMSPRKFALLNRRRKLLQLFNAYSS